MIPSPRHLATAAVLALTLAAGACSDGDGGAANAAAPTTAAADDPSTTTAAAAAEVAIDTFIFSPDPLPVAPGTTITFTNGDSTTHTVTGGTREAPQPDVIDASLAPGETTTWTPTEPGTYDYFCRLHSGPGMTGQVVVG